MTTRNSNSPAAAAMPPKIGMIVLKTDETVEDESRFYLRDSDVRLLATRIPVSDDINADSLRAMRGDLQQSLALFPDHYDFDVIAYACTSAATVIGEQVVHDDIQGFARTRHVTNPLTAVKAALAHLGARRIAYLSPYVPQVAATMQGALGAAGFQPVASAGFNLSSDRTVAALPPQQILEALQQFNGDEIDAAFVSCTSLKCAGIIPLAEQHLGKPVISSNQALLWHALTLAQAPLPRQPAFGRLFA